jgi:hypothetical protein
LPIPDPFDVAWEFSKGEMSLEKSVFDWFDSSLDRYQPKMTPPKPPRHAAALKNIRTNATTEVKAPSIEGEGEGVTVENHPESEHEVYDKGSTDNVHHEPDYFHSDTITEDEAKERVAEEEWMEEERAAIRRILEGDFSDFETETKDNVVAEIPFVAKIPDANLRDIEPEVVMPDKPKTVTEGIKAARERTLPKYITPSTDKSVVDRIHGLALDGNEDALKLFRDNKGDIVDTWPDEYDDNHEFFQKGIQTIVENPFANPFYDMSAFSIKKERPKGFVAPPAFTPPIDLIKQEQPNAIEGFETNEGDDLSLLPSSVFKNTDAPVVDNMSLLPTGWKNE